MRVLIVNVQVPFIRGGAEILAEGLRDAIVEAGHHAEIVAIPFNAYTPETVPEQILACRLLDLTSFAATPVDRVIGLKFPAYLVRHTNKVAWILHQHRSAYDLWEEPWGDLIQTTGGDALRDLIRHADRELLPEARSVYTISREVTRRLQEGCGIASTPLYPPVSGGERFECGDQEDYFFFPSRLSTSKRQLLVLQALARTRQAVRICFIGRPDNEAELRAFRAEIEMLGVADRAQWMGEVSADEKLRLYAHAVGVIFPPLAEDYGYVTAEAMLASKPVISCTDAGAPLELIADGETGLVVPPTPEALAEAMDALWSDRRRALMMGRRGREVYGAKGITWPRVVETLLG